MVLCAIYTTWYSHVGHSHNGAYGWSKDNFFCFICEPFMLWFCTCNVLIWRKGFCTATFGFTVRVILLQWCSTDEQIFISLWLFNRFGRWGHLSGACELAICFWLPVERPALGVKELSIYWTQATQECVFILYVVWKQLQISFRKYANNVFLDQTRCVWLLS